MKTCSPIYPLLMYWRKLESKLEIHKNEDYTIQMIGQYQGEYQYKQSVIEAWDSTAIGVYYCGYKTTEGTLYPLYIGKGVGADGMRGRLLDHLRDDYWPDVTHFGFRLCDTVLETESLETQDIARWKPKYNTQGK